MVLATATGTNRHREQVDESDDTLCIDSTRSMGPDGTGESGLMGPVVPIGDGGWLTTVPVTSTRSPTWGAIRGLP